MSFIDHAPHVNIRSLAARLSHAPQLGRDLLTMIHPKDYRYKALGRLWEDIDHHTTNWTLDERCRVDTYLTGLVFGLDTDSSGSHLSPERRSLCDRAYQKAFSAHQATAPAKPQAAA